MTIRAMIEAVERGEWDNKVAINAVGLGPAKCVEKAFNGSLDAALALHEAMLPWWRIYKMGEDDNTGSGWWAFLCTRHAPYQETSAFDQPTPARAWLLATLRAVEANNNN